ncbi:inorganic pyrophosphatase [Alkalispirillum mobile]|uniref:Inorganic pyrophosphatase n=1 Tax=Alkalispirillum mobile TaxID=85925 RepID=A0A498CFR5_9GAMM|nr:inorganic diphosphatase [Alkalispirillum mobile]RLK51141.1 inorganic pyrophosphatase [Alkalispirillum mobile]
MILERVGPGDKAPEEVNVIIEIPLRGEPVKYEVDKDSGAMFVDRFMGTAMHYPCNYGYIPNTLCDDGDPADVLVLTPFPVITGSVIKCRPIGVLKMTDEAGEDAKVLAVPVGKLTAMYEDVNNPSDLPQIMLDQISHFFEHYKDLEPGKWVRIDGWEDSESAREELRKSIENYEG